MEVFAGFAEQTDYEIGRLVKAIEDLGKLDNTLFIYIAGDNGTGAEGGMVGMYNEMTYFNSVPETVEDQLKYLDRWGGPETYPHMAAGWAVAFDAPFMWTKQVASNYGGMGKGGTGTLSVNGRTVAEGRIDRTQPSVFSADETADVGVDEATPVVDGIGEGSQTRFTGKIEKVKVEVK